MSRLVTIIVPMLSIASLARAAAPSRQITIKSECPFPVQVGFEGAATPPSSVEWTSGTYKQLNTGDTASINPQTLSAGRFWANPGSK